MFITETRKKEDLSKKKGRPKRGKEKKCLENFWSYRGKAPTSLSSRSRREKAGLGTIATPSGPKEKN